MRSVGGKIRYTVSFNSHSKKRCVEKGKHDYALNLILILCFQNGNTKFQNGVNSVKFLFLIFGGVVVNGCYKK